MVVNRVPRIGVKRSRAILRYDKDLTNVQVLFRVDLTISEIPTPVTPSYESRIDRESIKGRSVPARNFDPRYVECCFSVTNAAITRTVFIPYRPNTYEHRQHILELQQLLDSKFNGLLKLTYFGEST